MSKGHEEANSPESRRMSRGKDASYAARQLLYSFLGSALLFGLADILSPSNSLQQQRELQLLDREHTMIHHHSRDGQLEEDAAMHLRGKGISQGKAAKMQKDPGSYVPITCSDVLSDQLEKDEISNTANDDPNQRILHARQVVRKNNPNFWVSLHNQEFDGTRWIIMKKGDYYEKALSGAFSKILQDQSHQSKQKQQRVIDVGGNIGFFSLLSASNGPNVVVDAFEPNPKNRLRFCQSLRLNQWENEYNSVSTSHSVSQVNVYPYGVGQEEGVLSFEEHSNPGQGKFLPTKPRKGSKSITSEMRVIKLDEFAKARGWLDDEESHPDIAILKVDVEGLDALVIKGAAKLIQAKIIRNIFMEISTKNESQESLEDIKQALQIIQQAGYKLHRIGGWVGPNHPFEDAPSDPKLLVDAIIEEAQNTKGGQLNLWWA